MRASGAGAASRPITNFAACSLRGRQLVERAGDPFRVVRAFIYVTFGITGLAGCVTALLQIGDDASAALGNLAVNGAVLAAGVGVFFFDRSVTSKLREGLEKEVSRLPRPSRAFV